MSERSEFGRRAASAEEHRVPMQLHRIGARPGASGFGYFCRNKSNPLQAEAFDVGRRQGSSDTRKPYTTLTQSSVGVVTRERVRRSHGNEVIEPAARR